jgi:hypothetical protein
MPAEFAGINKNQLSETWCARYCTNSMGLNEESKYTKIVCAIPCNKMTVGKSPIDKGDLLIFMNNGAKVGIVGDGYVIAYLINGQ